MAATDDLIDFEVIETQKENIQSLPSGRSARSLASVLSPVALKSPSHTQDINDIKRQQFETELQQINDSDDPLDVYDRYVKWTLDAYPTAQATPQSQLLPLLERATKAFLSSTHYKNDPRYLRLWLSYIQLFSDAPRETFAYLSRHGVGEALALFYEEFAAWLEGAGRWIQAEEVYKMGIEREARPIERLVRKFGEFEKRLQARPEGTQEPTSPALPTVRAALVAKVDPFAASDAVAAPIDPQAAGRSSGLATGTKKTKLAIFSDEGEAAKPVTNGVSKGWENIGSMAERKKENIIGARPWNGETMKSGTSKAGMPPKMMIFKDQSISLHAMQQRSSDHPSRDQKVMNPRSGKLECVYVNLEAIYPDPQDPSIEFCFEELRAAKRGWLQRDWRQSRPKSQTVTSVSSLRELSSDDRINVTESFVVVESKPKTLPLNDINDENNENAGSMPRMPKSPSQQASLARKLRREDKANKTRKIKMREVKGETQTIQTNLDSPQGPRLRRKKSSEPTMTVHTKEAQDEMYDIFNAPLKPDDVSDEADSDASISDDDDYTSAGESTGTGRISGTTSEYEDDTHVELTEVGDAGQSENTDNNTGWTDFDTKRDVPRGDADVDEADQTETGKTQDFDGLEQEVSQAPQDEVVTPTSPTPFHENKQTWYIPLPPDDYVPPTRPYRDPEQVAQSRLPFMTPIVEKTESSLGTATGRRENDYFTVKTPCPKGERRTPIIDEDEEDVGSSPFQQLVLDSKDSVSSIPPPLLEPVVEPPLPGTPVPEQDAQSSNFPIRNLDSLAINSPPSASPTPQAPIIQDKQCNPMDDSHRNMILSQSKPPVSSHPGYHVMLDTDSNRRTEIRRYCKSVASANARHSTKNANDRVSHTMQMPPVLDFPGAESRLIVKRELGAGAFAPVYLVEAESPRSHTPGDNSSDDEDEQHLYALKAEDPPTAWEFHILRLCHTRLSQFRALASIITAHSLHLFRDEGYLLLAHSPHGTLLDLVNACARSPPASSSGSGCAGGAGSTGMDEALAMFFTSELLRAVEALHAVGIIHGDVKPDNVLVRFDSLPSTSVADALTGPYDRTGANGWNTVGIKLVDFGRGIDMRAYRGDVQFVADWAVGPTDCAEMQEARPWTFQGDCWGLAGCAFVCLCGRYLDAVAVDAGRSSREEIERGEEGMGEGEDGICAYDTAIGRKKWALKEPLKRYWQGELWSRLFGVCLNSGARGVVSKEEGGKLPCLRGLEGCRVGMEEWLEGEGERRGVGVRGLVGRAAGLCVAASGRRK